MSLFSKQNFLIVIRAFFGHTSYLIFSAYQEIFQQTRKKYMTTSNSTFYNSNNEHIDMIWLAPRYNYLYRIYFTHPKGDMTGEFLFSNTNLQPYFSKLINANLLTTDNLPFCSSCQASLSTIIK